MVPAEDSPPKTAYSYRVSTPAGPGAAGHAPQTLSFLGPSLELSCSPASPAARAHPRESVGEARTPRVLAPPEPSGLAYQQRRVSPLSVGKACAPGPRALSLEGFTVPRTRGNSGRGKEQPQAWCAPTPGGHAAGRLERSARGRVGAGMRLPFPPGRTPGPGTALRPCGRGKGPPCTRPPAAAAHSLVPKRCPSSAPLPATPRGAAAPSTARAAGAWRAGSGRKSAGAPATMLTAAAGPGSRQPVAPLPAALTARRSEPRPGPAPGPPRPRPSQAPTPWARLYHAPATPRPSPSQAPTPWAPPRPRPRHALS